MMAVVGAVLLLAGCATGGAVPQQQHSLAYHLVQIGNLPALAEDIDLAPDTRQALDALLEIRQVDEPDSRFDSKSPAFTDWGALAHLMHSSAPVVATPAVFTLLAWVPSYRADNRASARKRLVRQVDRAIRLALADSNAVHGNIENVTIHRLDDVSFAYRVQQADGWRCPECTVSVRINTPVLAKPPYFVQSSAAAEVHAFVYQPKSVASIAVDERRNYVAIETAEGAVPVEFLAALSWRLPPWMFVAVPAGTSVYRGQLLSFAYVLREGQPLLFVRPAAQQ